MNWGRLIREVGPETWTDAAFAFAGWVAVGIGIALLVRVVLGRRVWKQSFVTRSLGGVIERVAVAGGVLRGLSVAFSTLAAASGQTREGIWVERTITVAWIVVLVVAVVRGANAYFTLRGREEESADPATRSHWVVLRKLVSFGAITLGVVFAMNASGIDPGPILAGGAIGGVIIGLALQESLSNVFSGLLFAMDPSVRVGDHVRFGQGREGIVRQIGWRTTLIRQLDETLLVVPNSLISKQEIQNMSRPAPPTVVSVDCPVGYDEDLELIERIALRVAQAIQDEYPAVGGAAAPEPFVRWQAFGESGVVFRLFLTVGSSEGQYRARSDMVKRLHAALREAGVTIPYPVRDIRVAQAKEGDGPGGAGA